MNRSKEWIHGELLATYSILAGDFISEVKKDIDCEISNPQLCRPVIQ